MGFKISKLAQQHIEINNQLNQEKTIQDSIIKLLILGPGASGKSTVLKQMKIMHLNGFTEEEINASRNIIYSNIVQSMTDLLQMMQILQLKFEYPEREVDALLVNNINTEYIPGNVLQAVKSLWTDGTIQTCMKRSTEFPINESAEYFLSNLDRIASSTYDPTTDDMLRSRQMTNGVVEISFEIKKLTFRVFDVGGQRSQRKKWIHHFDDVKAIIFVASLSEYDQKLQENDNMNSMHESINLFTATCSSKWFVNSTVILFFNKTDLFQQKLRHSSLQIAFPNYEGTNAYAPCAEYIRLKFREQLHEGKQIYEHFTCATDTNQFEHIFSSTVDVILRENMKYTGLM